MKHLKSGQIAVSNFPYYKYSLGYALASLEKTGCGNMELYACDPHYHVDDATPADRAILKQKLAQHGLAVVCVTPEQCLYPLNIAAKNPVARQRSLATYLACLQLANELECGLCQFLAGFGCLDESDGAIWQRSLEALQYLAEAADAYGVDIALETSPKSYTCLEDTKTLVRMLDELGHGRIQGMVDTAVLGFAGETIEDAIALLGTRLRHVHFADGVPNGHLALGEGTLDLSHMLQCLDEAAYPHWLSLEIMNAQYVENPGEAMHKSYAWLRGQLG